MNDRHRINRAAWEKYQADYMKFQLRARPDYFTFFSHGGVDLDAYLIEMIGDVRGKRLLDTCCASDAVQAFSWHNLGAIVTACDITPSAIEIAKENARQMDLQVAFIVDDMQTLESVAGEQFDVVFATYPVWICDIAEACRTWHRVLKKGGKLLWHVEHPFTSCLEEADGALHLKRSYNDRSPSEYETFVGTPLAERFGGWSADLPSVEHFYRISDLLNAVCEAGFQLTHVHESSNADENPSDCMRKLPSDIALLAVKR